MLISYRVAFISIIVAFAASGFTTIFPILPELLEKLLGEGDHPFEFGVASSIYALMGFIFAPVAGLIADKVEKRNVIIFGTISYGISNFLLIFVDSYLAFLSVRAISGIFGTAILSPALSLVSNITDKKNQARNIAFVTAGLSFGTIVGPFLGGVLYNFWGLDLPFIFTGVLGALGGILGIFILPREKKHNVNQNQFPKNIATKQTSDDEKTENFLSKISKRLPSPKFIFGIFLVMSFLNGATWLLVEPGYIFYFYNTLNYGPYEFGIFVGIFGCFVFVGEIAIGGVSDKFGRIPVIIMGGVFFTSFFLILPFANNLIFICVVGSLAGIGVGLSGPALNALISDVADPKYRGFIFSLLTSAISLGGIIGPLIGGYIITKVNLQAVSWLAAGFCVLVIFLSFFLKFLKPYQVPLKNETEQPSGML